MLFVKTLPVLLLAVVTSAKPSDWQDFKDLLEFASKKPGLQQALDQEANHQSRVAGFGEPGYACPGDQVSPQVPTSVHALRPGDIKVIGAIGDSYTAANGAESTGVTDVRTEYRGKSFVMGGDDTLDQLVTVANVLRTSNADLQGPSEGVGTHEDFEVSKFNAAVAGAIVSELPAQAEDLVQRMRDNPDMVNIEQDWKLVNIFIGGNDLCDACTSNAVSGAEYTQTIRETIQYLKDNLPRTLVTVIGMARFDMLATVAGTRFTCRLAVGTFCSCAFSLSSSEHAANSIEFQQHLAVLDQGEFDTDDDFTVVIQPVLQDTADPPTSGSSIDLSLFAPDCFHLSTLGHEVLGRAVWNNMFQPMGAKDTQTNLNVHNVPVGCPDPNCPFIRTSGNSADCSAYLK